MVGPGEQIQALSFPPPNDTATLKYIPDVMDAANCNVNVDPGNELGIERLKNPFTESSNDINCRGIIAPITNTLVDLTLLISAITDFKEESINKVLNNPKSISKTNMLLPKGYIKRPDVKKINLS